MGWAGPLGQTLVAAVGMGGADPANVIASCKASVAAARTTVSPVDGTGKGTGPTTSSPSRYPGGHRVHPPPYF